MSKKKISKASLLNIILVTVIVVIGVFGYFYLKKMNPVDVVTANVPVDLPEYTYDFSIYRKDKALSDPYEVLAFNGNVYVSDLKLNSISVFDRTGKFLREIKNNDMQGPAGMCLYNGNLYVALSEKSMVMVLNPEGTVLDKIKFDDKMLLVDVFVENGFMYVLNNNSMTVEKYNLQAKKIVKTFGGLGKEEGKMYYPYGLAVRNGKVYVANALNNRIEVFDPEGSYLASMPAPAANGQKNSLSIPHGIAFDKAGRLYTAEGLAKRITTLDDKGQILFQVSKTETVGDVERDVDLPADVTFDELERMYVLEWGLKRVSVFHK